MPKGVLQALIDAVWYNQTREFDHRTDVEQYFEKLKLQGRYIQETWG